MSENWRQSEICIVIDDKSIDSTAKHLNCDGLLNYKFITQFAGKRMFFNWRTFAKVTGKMVGSVIRSIHFRLLSSDIKSSTCK